MKPILLVLSFLALLWACDRTAVAENDPPQATERAIPVDTRRIVPSDFVEYSDYYGRVEGIAKADLITTAGGPVEEIGVETGDRVMAGQSLGKINARKAQMAFEVATMNAKIAEENYDRALKLFKSGNRSQLSVDQAHLAWLQGKDMLLDAERMLNGALCVTPIHGVVVSRSVELHQEIPPGSPTFSIAQIDRLKIIIGIPEMDIAGIATGSEAEVTFAMHPGRVWKGRLDQLAREASSGTLTFRAEIHIDNSEGLILPGVTARARLVLRTIENAVVVPTAAILNESEGTFVMVEEDGRVRRLPVVTGPTNRTHTVVMEGLSAGSQLILEGNHLVTDGMGVSVKSRG